MVGEDLLKTLKARADLIQQVMGLGGTETKLRVYFFEVVMDFSFRTKI